MFGGGTVEEAPELFALLIEYAQLERHAHQCHKPADDVILMRRWPILRHSLQTFEYAAVVFAGTVDSSHDRLIARYEPFSVHLRHEVQRAVGVFAGAFRQKSSFTL